MRQPAAEATEATRRKMPGSLAAGDAEDWRPQARQKAGELGTEDWLKGQIGPLLSS